MRIQVDFAQSSVVLQLRQTGSFRREIEHVFTDGGVHIDMTLAGRRVPIDHVWYYTPRRTIHISVTIEISDFDGEGDIRAVFFDNFDCLSFTLTEPFVLVILCI